MLPLSHPTAFAPCRPTPVGEPGRRVRLSGVLQNPLGALLAVLGWLAATVFGTWAMMAYANVPGESGAAPATWPVASRLPRPAGRPTLVVFVHPKCPCSRASLGELALLMAHSAGRLEARAVFVAPVEKEVAWSETDLWRTAAAIPGVEVRHDAGGREAGAFHSATSGDTLLYAADGRLLFHGGITQARGHAGDNAGRAALEAWLSGQPSAPAATPVFGCGLLVENPRESGWMR